MFNEGASSPLLVEVAFSGNLAGASGGGAANTEGATPVFNKVVFNGNTSNMFGGGMLIIGSPTLVNVEFKGNQAQSGGGGVFTYRGSTPTLTNVIFSNNTALADGGGMLNNGNPTLTNVTFSGNVAAGNGGGMYNNAVNPNLRNVIIWGNTAGNSQASIYNYGGSAPLITYSDILRQIPPLREEEEADHATVLLNQRTVGEVMTYSPITINPSATIQEAAERIRERWGLNDPAYLQYLKFLFNAVRGDLGFSFRFNQPVTRIILERFPATPTRNSLPMTSPR